MSTSSSLLGSSIPTFLYGTAWKEHQTQSLVELALAQGFRGIDTANQRKHYFEAAVGAGIAAAVQRGLVSRDDLFLQTKFTFRPGQDQRLPYDPKAPIATQVEQSFASSLEHLQTNFIDSYVLHGPSLRSGLGPEDREAWRAMEAIHDSGRARMLGISNVTLEQLFLLCEQARVKPRFVQNRCYAVTGWDRRIRQFCDQQQIVYQGFSLLTANRDVLRHRELEHIARKHGLTVSQLVFRFAIDAGMLPLTGTTSAEHMQQDLAVTSIRLDSDAVARIESIALE